MTRPTIYVACLCILSAAACGDDAPAAGTLAVSVYGEEYIEEGIPAAEFADGWAVTFDKFLIVVGEVSAARGHDDTEPFAQAGFKVYDLAVGSAGAGFPVVDAQVPGGLYDHLGFRVAPSATASAGNASAADVMLMTQGGFSVYVEGTAVKGAETKSFAWGFDTETTYHGCHTAADVDGGTGSSQITIHGDHLFYDDLISTEPNVAFDVIAQADGDADGAVTEAELAAFDISTLANYQVGSFPIDDLYGFIRHQTSTLGHIDGEGHCDSDFAD